MSTDLMESFRNASTKAKHKVGMVTLVCLDDENLDQDKYGRMGDRTIVPRAREEGGIAGLPLGDDCKYGEGVVRRRLEDDGHGGFKVESQEDNFRPDHAMEQQDLFSPETLEAAGIEAPSAPVPLDDPLAVLRKQASAAIADNGSVTGAAPSNGDNAMMMTMMQTMLQMAQARQPALPAPVPELDKLEQAPGKDVRFSGDFGRITVRYADVIVRDDFVVLVSQPNQATTYEPPLSMDNRPIQLEVDGNRHSVVNLGLSFTHKGDILLLMPLTRNPEDANAEETE